MDSRRVLFRSTKSLLPTDDPGKFDLTIDSTTYQGPSNGGFGNGGSTDWVNVGNGTHTVGEAGHSGTSLSDYDSSTSCTLNGQPTSAPYALTYGDKLDCTITNKRLPRRSEERRVGKESRSRWSPHH